MRKPPYVPTSKQGIAEQDFARWLDVDGVGMEKSHESLSDMKVLRFAVETKPADWPLIEWAQVCFEVAEELFNKTATFS